MEPEGFGRQWRLGGMYPISLRVGGGELPGLEGVYLAGVWRVLTQAY